MGVPALARDFSECLKLFNSHDVKYLLVGGYAVSYYGYIRATNDLDIWIERSSDNATRVHSALAEFGFRLPSMTVDLFCLPDQLLRMGMPPIRIEILTSISGVDFDVCYSEREMMTTGDLAIPVISLNRLRENKVASGRAKDLADLENLL